MNFFPDLLQKEEKQGGCGCPSVLCHSEWCWGLEEKVFGVLGETFYDTIKKEKNLEDVYVV